MGTYKLKPSSAQVNEGDTLTTTLETTDVITGTTLYYRVVGKGINAKDFLSGALKGSLKVGADGKAMLTHSLKADKATEGSESLTIEVFSDKKMINRVGTSDAVTVSDTSMKAVKGAVASGSTPMFKDPVSGKQYKSDSIVEGVFGSPDNRNTSFENGRYEIEVISNIIVYTQQLYGPKFGSSNSFVDFSRVAIFGKFQVSKYGDVSGTASRVETANAQYDPSKSYLHETTSSGSAKNIAFSNRLWESIDPASLTDGAKLDSSLFPSNWWQNPFDPNLV